MIYTKFVYVITSTLEVQEEREIPLGIEDGEWLTRDNALLSGKARFLAPLTTITHAYNSAIELDEGYITTYDDVTKIATKENSIRNLTQEELDAAELSNDIQVLTDAGKDISLVLVELVDYLLANTAMDSTDFTADVKQAYLDLKVIADRIKG